VPIIYAAGFGGAGAAAGVAFAVSLFDSPLESDFESDFASDFESPCESPFVSVAGLSEPDDAELAFDAGFAPLFLKSVAYQPLPFNWKPAAVTIFEKVGLPHFVHTVRGASLTFSRNSCWWPQLPQRYS
jgi:hypothetical protein